MNVSYQGDRRTAQGRLRAKTTRGQEQPNSEVTDNGRSAVQWTLCGPARRPCAGRSRWQSLALCQRQNWLAQCHCVSLPLQDIRDADEHPAQTKGGYAARSPPNNICGICLKRYVPAVWSNSNTHTTSKRP